MFWVGSALLELVDRPPMPNLQEYMTIKDAAGLLGVTPNTLRNWGAAGKITEYRHPINNYRLYKESDLAALLRQIDASDKAGGTRERPETACQVGDEATRRDLAMPLLTEIELESEPDACNRHLDSSWSAVPTH